MKSKRVPLLIGLSAFALVCCAPFTARGVLIDGKSDPATRGGTGSRQFSLPACSKGILEGNGKTPNAGSLDCTGGPGSCFTNQ